ncbi:hypothetical protein [Halococcus qingdaonensis]|uniref:hypothetical protein n=1 Tax=Halococcus qingdaonensis TaxID=224402 RepID=UPI002116FA5E|nr:hypothetical protein [Halococcus qingdaonensis]
MLFERERALARVKVANEFIHSRIERLLESRIGDDALPDHTDGCIKHDGHSRRAVAAG